MAVTTRRSIDAYQSKRFDAARSSRASMVTNATTSSTSSRICAPVAPSAATVHASSGSLTVATGEVGKCHPAWSGNATW